jgi:prepilin-type N-terminal cleavage/methylation domain-containing protein
MTRQSVTNLTSRERKRAVSPENRSLTVAARARARSAFTLIELLVVIGIIAVLAAILIPMVMSSWKHANRTKLQADFATIGQALEEWQKDHQGQYPQVTQPNTGFAVLARDLVGVYGDGVTGNPPTPDPNDPPGFVSGGTHKPGDCVQSSGQGWVCLVENSNSPATPEWAQFDANDLADGLGTRLSAGGKKVGPYLKPEAFRVRGCALLDPNDKPILYFPAKPGGKANLSKTIAGTPSFVAQSKISLFDADDNLLFFRRFNDASDPHAMARIRALLGDVNNNGLIDAGEEAASTGPYLLWAPGPDGLYGPEIPTGQSAPTATTITKCDDVTNFGK